MQASVEDEKGQVQLFLNSVPLLSSLQQDDKAILVDAFQEEMFAGGWVGGVAPTHWAGWGQEGGGARGGRPGHGPPWRRRGPAVHAEATTACAFDLQYRHAHCPANLNQQMEHGTHTWRSHPRQAAGFDSLHV